MTGIFRWPAAQVDKLEQEKLKAVGLRNKVAALSEVRWQAGATPYPLRPGTGG